MAQPSDVANRVPITISIMLATTMNTLDTTIANVALPHIQGSVSAGPDQIAWVLTSYIVAAAIMTPLTGWLDGRIGRKRLILFSVTGFVVASMFCGISTTVAELVGFRMVQGICGAALLPLSQMVLLDIYPREKYGQAMGVFGAGVILGPILGPVVGGYLTEYLSWRWCFFINLPVGLLSLAGTWFFMSGDGARKATPFDFLGFGMLALFIGGLQLMLDRGPGQDWFQSKEIWAETIIAVIGLWVFIIHTLTAEHPFIDRRLMRDRNFVVACFFFFVLGVLLFSAMALLPPLLQVLLGYPVLTAGIVSTPRGLGSFVGMLLGGRLVSRIDTRALLLTGLLIGAFAYWQMANFDLTMPRGPLIISGLIQGLGTGMIFVPLSTMAFATLPQALRPEGTAISTLSRNIGSSVGISITQALVVANTQAMHESLSGRISPADPVVRQGLAALPVDGVGGLALLNGEIGRQAAMVGYIDAFRLMLFIALACIPMLLLLRRPKTPGGMTTHVPFD